MSPLVLGFKFQKFIHESCHDGVSGTDNDEQPLNNSASVSARSVLPISKRQYTSCKRRAFISEDDSKTLTFADYCKPCYLNSIGWCKINPCTLPSSWLNDFESVGLEKV